MKHFLNTCNPPFVNYLILATGSIRSQAWYSEVLEVCAPKMYTRHTQPELRFHNKFYEGSFSPLHIACGCSPHSSELEICSWRMVWSSLVTTGSWQHLHTPHSLPQLFEGDRRIWSMQKQRSWNCTCVIFCENQIRKDISLPVSWQNIVILHYIFLTYINIYIF